MSTRLYFPAEWQQHRACWMAFPYRKEEWANVLEQAQTEFAALCRAITEQGAEKLCLLVADADVEARARSLIGNAANIEWIRMSYGDCWTRDTLPIFGLDEEGETAAAHFRFNGWGERFTMPGDAELAQRVIELLEIPNETQRHSELVCEGGAIEHNGAGQGVVIASCLLDQQRNPKRTREECETELKHLLGLNDFIWLEQGHPLDHTSGHSDMVARFVAENTIVYTQPATDHPHADALRAIENSLESATKDTAISLVPLPQPTENRELPQTYCNFYIANRALMVPQYGCAQDALALDILGTLSPGREIIGLSSRYLLEGGGSFHCVTQSQYAKS